MSAIPRDTFRDRDLRLSSLLLRLLHGLRTAIERDRAARELQTLSERQLMDAGLTRGDVATRMDIEMRRISRTEFRW